MSVPTSETTPLAKAQVYGEGSASVQVTAPTDLAGGYQFYVDSSEVKYLLVKVPQGGVTAGQVFSAQVISEERGGPHKIPYGDWRDSICNCLAFGLCHPQCCLSYWFGPCALGQILSRMNLDWRGKVTDGQPRSPFVVWFSLFAAYLVVTCCLSAVIEMFGGTDDEDDSSTDTVVPSFGDMGDAEGWVTGLNIALNAIGLAFGLMVLLVSFRARRYIRQKYGIPERRCRGCEDCCCVFWCAPCSLCQMARHTGNYRDYPSTCCSERGFGPGVPAVV